ncbi:MAG: Kelch repeat-containing protein, partial [Gaiellaceae bacterium]
RRWAREAPLPAPRTNLAAVALDGKIYALGGLDPLDATRSAFVYDVRANSWGRVASLPVALQALAAVAFHGEIWVLGGRDASGKVSRRVWIYNPRLDRWRAGPTMPAPMETFGAAVVGNRVYAVEESKTLIYDARTSRWTRGPELRVPRHALALFSASGRLFAIGGCTVQLADSPVVESLAVAG